MDYFLLLVCLCMVNLVMVENDIIECLVNEYFDMDFNECSLCILCGVFNIIIWVFCFLYVDIVCGFFLEFDIFY